MSNQNFKIVWTSAARRALDDIEHYIAAENPVAADRMGRTIRERVALLAFTPQMGFRSKVRASYGDIREIVVSPFRILYRIEGETVVLILIWHGARRNPGFKDFLE